MSRKEELPILIKDLLCRINDATWETSYKVKEGNTGYSPSIEQVQTVVNLSKEVEKYLIELHNIQ